jgi:hypothetical protein
MRNLRRLRKLWNDVLDELEAAVLAWILKASLARHKPVEIDPEGFAGAYCLACVEHWPCKRWEEVTDLARKLDIDGS